VQLRLVCDQLLGVHTFFLNLNYNNFNYGGYLNSCHCVRNYKIKISKSL
jgi:hypothetical protein